MIELVIGVDVGINGGIVLMNKSLSIIRKWTIARTRDGQPDIHAYARVFKILKKYLTKKNLPYQVFIEEVHAIFMASASSTFKFGMMSMLPEAICCTLNMPFVRVQPKAWQKVSWAGVIPVRKTAKKGKKAGGIDTKATSEKAVKRLFPTEDFRASKRSKLNHDGLIDAALIAYYGMRINWSRDGF